jgi:hypothetical protein
MQFLHSPAAPTLPSPSTAACSAAGDASYLTSVNGPRLTTIKGNVGLRITW